jgi:predicted nucleic acid-binding protein
MTSYVVLDSEAVSALAFPRERGVSARRAQAILAEAERRNALVRIPAVVLAEVYRGKPRDAGIDRIVNEPNRVVTLDARAGRLAGRMLGRRKLDSRHAVDALVVATAATLGAAVVVTGDPSDLAKLASDHRNVVIVGLD